MKIISINVGEPKVVRMDGKDVKTGYCKEPIDKPLFLSKTNFEGDGQAEAYHGGVDKAICVYPFEHYAYWEQELDCLLPTVAFGENLTVTGMVENDIHIGDIFRIGQAIVQVTQPRRPCYKISGRHAIKDLTERVQKSGYTGYYLRVLEVGYVDSNSMVERLTIDPLKVTVAMANENMYHNTDNANVIEMILEVEALSESWRKKFTKKLEQLTKK